MGKKNPRRQQNADGAGGLDGADTTKFTAPTPGLEEVYFYFTWGTAKDAAKFEDTVSQSVGHVGTSPWPQSSVAPKAMSTLQAHVFEVPVVPTREYWANDVRTVKTNNILKIKNRPIGHQKRTRSKLIYRETERAATNPRLRTYCLFGVNYFLCLGHRIKHVNPLEMT